MDTSHPDSTPHHSADSTHSIPPQTAHNRSTAPPLPRCSAASAYSPNGRQTRTSSPAPPAEPRYTPPPSPPPRHTQTSSPSHRPPPQCTDSSRCTPPSLPSAHRRHNNTGDSPS